MIENNFFDLNQIGELFVEFKRSFVDVGRRLGFPDERQFWRNQTLKSPDQRTQLRRLTFENQLKI